MKKRRLLNYFGDLSRGFSHNLQCSNKAKKIGWGPAGDNRNGADSRQLSAHQRMNPPTSPDMLLLRIWIGLGNFHRIGKFARHRRRDDDKADCRGDRPIQWRQVRRSALEAPLTALQSTARRPTFASW